MNGKFDCDWMHIILLTFLNTPYDVLTWTYLFLFAFMAFTAFNFLFYWIFCILRRLFVAQCDSKKTEIIGYFVKLRRHTINGTESGCQRNLSNLNKYQNTLLSILSAGWNLWKVFLAHWQFSNSHTKNTNLTILTPDILSIEISWHISANVRSTFYRISIRFQEFYFYFKWWIKHSFMFTLSPADCVNTSPFISNARNIFF